MASALNSNYIHNFKVSTHFLAIYIILAPLDFLPLFPGVSFQRVLALLPILGSLFYISSMKIYIDRFFLLPILYTTFLVVTTFYSVNYEATQLRILTTGTNIFLILLLGSLEYSSNEIDYLKKMFVLSGWVALLLILYSTRGLVTDRITVTLGGAQEDHNNLVGYFIFTIIHSIEQYINKKKLRHLGIIFIFLVVVIVTGSRGGLLAVLGASASYMIFWAVQHQLKFSVILKTIVLFLLILGIIVLIVNFLPLEMRERFIFDEGQFLQGGETRFEIWNSIIDSFVNAPILNQIFGYGAGTVREFSLDRQVGHNIWFDALIETGIFGIILLFIVYISFYKKVSSLKSYIVASTFIGYMLMAMSLSLYRFRPIWNILLLIIILKNYNITVLSKTETEKHTVVI